MRAITTRQAETMTDIRRIFALRYDYYIRGHELQIDADHAGCELMLPRDCLALQFGVYAGDDLVGCFRMEFGPSEQIAFAADWAFSDFVDEPLDMTAIVSGFCVSPYLRDNRIIDRMVRESVAIAKEFQLPHVFFEASPELWPQFHVEGLSRRGGALADPETGLQTAVYRLDASASVHFPASHVGLDGDDLDFVETAQPAQRPSLKVVGGRGR
jgi:hypothetical protein